MGAALHSEHDDAGVLGLVFGLDVNGNRAMLVVLTQGFFDPVADGVGLVDRHLAGNDEVELDEGHLAGVPCADVVRLEKGHTEGLEPKITEALIELMLSAPGGKLRSL